jgi:acyl carrier protein
MTASPISVDQALAMMAEAFQVPASELTPERTRDTLPDWDSMGALMLMAEIDERFGVELTADESRAMTRIADVLEFLRRHALIAP